MSSAPARLGASFLLATTETLFIQNAAAVMQSVILCSGHERIVNQGVCGHA